MGVWHPGFNPILHPNHRILGTVLVADSKHHWIVKWDAIKSTVSDEIEHHHSLHHFTALRLEDNHESKVLVGIIPNSDDVEMSVDSDKPGYCTQPDVDASSDNRMMQQTDDDTSLSGSTSSNPEDMAGIDLMKKSSTDETVEKKRESTTKKLILLTLLNVPIVTPCKNNKNDKNDKNDKNNEENVNDIDSYSRSSSSLPTSISSIVSESSPPGEEDDKDETKTNVPNEVAMDNNEDISHMDTPIRELRKNHNTTAQLNNETENGKADNGQDNNGSIPSSSASNSSSSSSSVSSSSLSSSSSDSDSSIDESEKLEDLPLSQKHLVLSQSSQNSKKRRPQPLFDPKEIVIQAEKGRKRL